MDFSPSVWIEFVFSQDQHLGSIEFIWEWQVVILGLIFVELESLLGDTVNKLFAVFLGLISRGIEIV